MVTFTGKRTTEERENVKETEVLERLKTLSPTLQIEYLENLNKRMNLLPGLRVLVCTKLAALYEAKGLHAFSANILTKAADAAVIYKDKKDLYLKVGVLWLKSNEQMFASDAFKKALEVETPGERKNLQKVIRSYYFAEAENFEKNGKSARAVELYERIMKTQQEGEDMKVIRMKLANLYQKVGKVKESLDMKKSI